MYNISTHSKFTRVVEPFDSINTSSYCYSSFFSSWPFVCVCVCAFLRFFFLYFVLLTFSLINCFFGDTNARNCLNVQTLSLFVLLPGNKKWMNNVTFSRVLGCVFFSCVFFGACGSIRLICVSFLLSFQFNFDD